MDCYNDSCQSGDIYMESNEICRIIIIIMDGILRIVIMIYAQSGDINTEINEICKIIIIM